MFDVPNGRFLLLIQVLSSSRARKAEIDRIYLKSNTKLIEILPKVIAVMIML